MLLALTLAQNQYKVLYICDRLDKKDNFQPSKFLLIKISNWDGCPGIETECRELAIQMKRAEDGQVTGSRLPAVHCDHRSTGPGVHPRLRDVL